MFRSDSTRARSRGNPGTSERELPDCLSRRRRPRGDSHRLPQRSSAGRIRLLTRHHDHQHAVAPRSRRPPLPPVYPRSARFAVEIHVPTEGPWGIKFAVSSSHEGWPIPSTRQLPQVFRTRHQTTQSQRSSAPPHRASRAVRCNLLARLGDARCAK